MTVDTVEYAIAMLRIIAGQRCRTFISPHGACAKNGRVLGAYYGAEAWCDACIAASVLDRIKADEGKKK